MTVHPRGFLIDRNLPGPLRFVLPGECRHARELGDACTDTQLWNVARDESLVIVTKDADCYDRMRLSDPPPWVVQVTLGNLRRHELLEHVAAAWPAVGSLLPEHQLILLRAGSVEGVA